MNEKAAFLRRVTVENAALSKTLGDVRAAAGKAPPARLDSCLDQLPVADPAGADCDEETEERLVGLHAEVCGRLRALGAAHDAKMAEALGAARAAETAAMRGDDVAAARGLATLNSLVAKGGGGH